jgi:hypothetical protein
MKKSTHNIQYCDETRNVDDMLARFDDDKNVVLGLLKEKPEVLAETLWNERTSPVSIDNHCLCNLGKRQHQYTLEEKLCGKCCSNENIANYYMCSQCQNMARLINLSPNCLDKAFYIECGTFASNMLILLESPLKRLCSSHIGNKFLSDDFTNGMLVSWYLDEILNGSAVNMKNRIPCVKLLHTAFICRRVGYGLYESPEIGCLKNFQQFNELLVGDGKPSPTSKVDMQYPIKADVVKGILMQLFSVYDVLANYNFSYGCINGKSVVFSSDSCSYTYNGKLVDCAVTLKLCHFSNSSIQVKENGLTVCNIKSTLLGTDMVYARRYGGNGSYMDVYGFLVVLMADPEFFATVMADAELNGFWKSLWESSQYDLVQSNLYKLHAQYHTFNQDDTNINWFFKGLMLNPDVISNGWVLLSK